MDETTKSNILKIINSENLYNNSNHFSFIFNYVVYKYTFNFNDLIAFTWKNNRETIEKYLLLYNLSQKYITNIHNFDKRLLVNIYNYMVEQYNILNINLILEKTYNYKECDNDNNYISTYSTSILDNLECLNIKNDIDNLYTYICRFYNISRKCNNILKILTNKCENLDGSIPYVKNYNKRIIYVYNVYNFILKHKLYKNITVNTNLIKKSNIILEELNTHKFNNTDTINDTKNDNYKPTNKNKKIIDSILKLQEIIKNYNMLANNIINVI